MPALPTNLRRLRAQEYLIRKQSLDYIQENHRLLLHLEVIEQAMDVAETFRQFGSSSQSMYWKRLMGLRLFNGFAAALNLTLIGYHQKSALVIRDILDTCWLIDLFRLDENELEAWQTLEGGKWYNAFKPSEVRNKLDKCYGVKTSLRHKVYKEFSEFAAHPTRKSGAMLSRDGAFAESGPFFHAKSLETLCFQMGRVALETSNVLSDLLNHDDQMPHAWAGVYALVLAKRQEWLALNQSDL